MKKKISHCLTAFFIFCSLKIEALILSIIAIVSMINFVCLDFHILFVSQKNQRVFLINFNNSSPYIFLVLDFTNHTNHKATFYRFSDVKIKCFKKITSRYQIVGHYLNVQVKNFSMYKKTNVYINMYV